MIKLEEEELKSRDPGFWTNPKAAEEQMRVIRSISTWTTGFLKVDKLMDDFLVLYDFFETGEAESVEVDKAFEEVLQEIEALEARNMLRNEEDRLGAVLRINAGAGGST